MLFYSIELSVYTFGFSFSLEVSSLSHVQSYVPFEARLVQLVLFSGKAVDVPTTSYDNTIIAPSRGITTVRLARGVSVVAEEYLLFGLVLGYAFFFEFFVSTPLGVVIFSTWPMLPVRTILCF